MVVFEDVWVGNFRVVEFLLLGVIGVFVGVIFGIGEFVFKFFVKYMKGLKIYFIGRL